MTKTIGFIGGGHMSRGIITGLSRNACDVASMQMDSVWVYDRTADKLLALQKEFGINMAEDNRDLIARCDTVVLSVKPQVLKESLEPVAELMRSNKPLVISVAAGIRSKAIDAWLGGGFAIVRAMPNMGSAIGFGATGMFANKNVDDDQKSYATELMNSVGITHWVEDEEGIDVVTALSGSGPAYFMLFIESLIQSAMDAGMDQQGAKLLALQTARGTTELIQGSELSISRLIDSICLAGGTTEQAVRSFREDKIELVVAKAFSAAKIRAEQLADELSS